MLVCLSQNTLSTGKQHLEYDQRMAEQAEQARRQRASAVEQLRREREAARLACVARRAACGT